MYIREGMGGLLDDLSRRDLDMYVERVEEREKMKQIEYVIRSERRLRCLCLYVYV